MSLTSRWTGGLRGLLIALTLSSLGACISATTRVGSPIDLASGEPASECEQKRWATLAPAQSVSHEVERAPDRSFASRKLDGLALFDRNDVAMTVSDVLPDMHEPLLAERHLAVTAPIEARNRETVYWAVGAFALLGASIGYAATLDAHPSPGQFAVMSTGLALSLAASIIGWVRTPRRAQRITLELRQHLFPTGEDDAQAVQRGAVRWNEAVRRSCGQ